MTARIHALSPPKARPHAELTWHPPLRHRLHRPYAEWLFALGPSARYPEILFDLVAPAISDLRRRKGRRWVFGYGRAPASPNPHLYLSVAVYSDLDCRYVDHHLRARFEAALHAGRLRSADPGLYWNALSQAPFQRTRQGKERFRILNDFREVDCAMVMELIGKIRPHYPRWRFEALADIVFLQEALGIARHRRAQAVRAWLRVLAGSVRRLGAGGTAPAGVNGFVRSVRRQEGIQPLLRSLRSGHWEECAGEQVATFYRFRAKMAAIGARLRKLRLGQAKREKLIHWNCIHFHLMASGVSNWQEMLLYRFLCG